MPERFNSVVFDAHTWFRTEKLCPEEFRLLELAAPDVLDDARAVQRPTVIRIPKN